MIFVFFFVDLFDNEGTLVGYVNKADFCETQASAGESCVAFRCGWDAVWSGDWHLDGDELY